MVSSDGVVRVAAIARKFKVVVISSAAAGCQRVELASVLTMFYCYILRVTMAVMWVGFFVGCGESTSRNSKPTKFDTSARRAANDSSTDASAASEPSDGPTWFVDVTADSGVDFVHQTGTSPEKPFPAANGSGVAAIDFDLDGNSDLYFATGTPFPVDLKRTDPINRMYRNLGGWRFEEVTTDCGLGFNGYSAGLAVGDYDGDGFADVYVACYGENRLFRNLGDGTFLPIGRESGVGHEGFAASALMLDYDADGLLDVYVCNYGKWSLAEFRDKWCGDFVNKIRRYCNPSSIEPVHDVLYRNLGDGSFAEVTDDVGLATRPQRAQGAVAADLNQDGWIDLYVGNDGHPNALFVNQRDGTFKDISELCGAGYDDTGAPQAGMGVAAADVNNDGRFEIFVTNFKGENNAFYTNIGSEQFLESSARYGLRAPSMPWVGWGTVFADFDFDGWLDLVVTNGHVDDNREDSPYQSPPLVWHNVEGRFETLKADSAGDYFARRHVGRGLIVADLDNDSDPDLVFGHQDASPTLLRNDRPQALNPRPSVVVVQLVGTHSNRDAIGSSITMRSGGRSVVQQVKGGGSYLSASDLRKRFAVLPGEETIELEILWPTRNRSVIPGVKSGGHYIVVEPLEANSAPRMLRYEP